MTSPPLHYVLLRHVRDMLRHVRDKSRLVRDMLVHVADTLRHSRDMSWIRLQHVKTRSRRIADLLQHVETRLRQCWRQINNMHSFASYLRLFLYMLTTRCITSACSQRVQVRDLRREIRMTYLCNFSLTQVCSICYIYGCSKWNKYKYFFKNIC